MSYPDLSYVLLRHVLPWWEYLIATATTTLFSSLYSLLLSLLITSFNKYILYILSPSIVSRVEHDRLRPQITSSCHSGSSLCSLWPRRIEPLLFDHFARLTTFFWRRIVEAMSLSTHRVTASDCYREYLRALVQHRGYFTTTIVTVTLALANSIDKYQ